MSDKQPLVSILIPVYNMYETYLEIGTERGHGMTSYRYMEHTGSIDS